MPPCLGKTMRGQRYRSKLRLKALTSPQRAVYDAILRGRKVRPEARSDALELVERATSRGELEAELEFWTAPPQPIDKLQTMLGLAMRDIATGKYWE